MFRPILLPTSACPSPPLPNLLPNFNLCRVTEGKCAVKLVAKGEGVSNWASQQTFRQLQETLKLASPGDLVPAIERHLREGPYSIADVAEGE